MKKKSKLEPAIEMEPVSSAEVDRTRRAIKCTVCGSETSPNSVEGLCWVCRRLKISAWRDSDNQLSAQE